MAKQRQAQNATPTTTPCPECGKPFDRPASLGAHRRAAHGVAGSSRRGRPGAGGIQYERWLGQAGEPHASIAPPRQGESTIIDRDALLRALFPAGIPARESVIRRVNSWLDEAEQLAGLR